MNVTFEHTIVIYDNNIAEVLIGFVNHILFADNEESLRRIVAEYAEKSDLDRYFIFGYGHRHMWVKQRKITDPQKTFDYRILIVKF